MVKPLYPVLCAIAVIAFTSGSPSAAVPLTPIPGYVCMGLKITDAQAHDFNFEVPIRLEPNSKSQVVQTAAGVLAMRSPRHEVAGFVELLTAKQTPGWIESRYVGPHTTPLNPRARCWPVVSPQGRVTFSYSDS